MTCFVSVVGHKLMITIAPPNSEFILSLIESRSEVASETRDGVALPSSARSGWRCGVSGFAAPRPWSLACAHGTGNAGGGCTHCSTAAGALWFLGEPPFSVIAPLLFAK